MNETQAMLELQHLKKFFPVEKKVNGQKAVVKAVNDVSLQVHRNEVYGLVGETGCGKSTLGRTMLRLLEPTDGRILYQGEDITKIHQQAFRQYRSKLQMIFQDPYTSLNPRKNVGEILTEVLAIQHVGNRADWMNMALDIIEKVGLKPEHYYRYPHEFSGGQRQRIGIARALILHPEFVVCDEPVSALDVSIQAQILNLLMDLQEQMGLTYLFITHDLSVVKHISDEIMVMYLGKCVEKAPAEEIFRNPVHPYTKALLAAIPIPSIESCHKKRTLLQGEVTSPINPKPGCRFAARCPLAKESCRTGEMPLVEVSPGHFSACPVQG